MCERFQAVFFKWIYYIQNHWDWDFDTCEYAYILQVKTHFGKPNWRNVFKRVAVNHKDERVGLYVS